MAGRVNHSKSLSAWAQIADLHAQGWTAHRVVCGQGAVVSETCNAQQAQVHGSLEMVYSSGIAASIAVVFSADRSRSRHHMHERGSPM